MSKFNLATDCILQDKSDFAAILRAIERYQTTKDEHYLNVIKESCNTAIRDITKLLKDLDIEEGK